VSEGWSFYALGTPAPQGSKSPKGRTKTGHTIMVESSKKVTPWREAVKAAGEGAGPCLDGPLVVCMVFTVARPKSAPKRITIPDRTPDLSKLARSTEDAITDVGLWADDARVAEYCRLAKVFPYGSMPVTDAWALPVPGVVVACCSNGMISDLIQMARLEAERARTKAMAS
jgi:Holliday junction resolvase RusA-like endonuclease